jgi:hypothetical protein
VFNKAPDECLYVYISMIVVVVLVVVVVVLVLVVLRVRHENLFLVPASALFGLLSVLTLPNACAIVGFLSTKITMNHVKNPTLRSKSFHAVMKKKKPIYVQSFTRSGIV